MKLYDINTSVGHWPFRKLSIESISALKKQLESKGIEGAAVVNTNGIFYKNCHDANIELASWIGKKNDFFAGIATVNPVYAQWEKDLRQCVKEFGFRALRLLPVYHGYELRAKEVDSIVDLAVDLDIPVLIPQRIVDMRQRHWLDVEKIVGFDDVCALASRHPAAKIIHTECQISAAAFDDKKSCKNLYIEISRLRSCYGQQISKIASVIGCDKLFFGSGAPFKEISPSILKLEHADLEKKQRDAISFGNALKILKIK